MPQTVSGSMGSLDKLNALTIPVASIADICSHLWIIIVGDHSSGRLFGVDG